MLQAPGAGHGVIGVAFAGLHANIAQSARMAAAATGVHGRQRFAAILKYQPPRGLNGAEYPARERGRRFQKLAMGGITEVEVQVPLAGRQEGAGYNGLSFQRFDRGGFIHLRSHDGSHRCFAIHGGNGYEFPVASFDGQPGRIGAVESTGTVSRNATGPPFLAVAVQPAADWEPTTTRSPSARKSNWR